MTFEWDSEKEKINIEKHDGITFSIAAKVFSDRKRIEKYDVLHSSIVEDRWNVIGMVEKVLFVVYTEITDDRIRIISARAAEKEEINEYFSNYDIR
ncbi:MAG: BrnT family toxin [Treponema sp.]|nr:BrnT family toxin [Treponema sp.]MBQ1670160.1 BrnT family toxin [Treponema sp.]MBQ1726084.1 BrnT family toxin [Treponema sp.]MBQ2355335.1 BrnT family toxin [Treponema sp.]MBQ2465775.1 BrnT family toxin [Treponema sp.]